jgi:hypothetical protein
VELERLVKDLLELLPQEQMVREMVAVVVLEQLPPQFRQLLADLLVRVVLVFSMTLLVLPLLVVAVALVEQSTTMEQAPVVLVAVVLVVLRKLDRQLRELLTSAVAVAVEV